MQPAGNDPAKSLARLNHLLETHQYNEIDTWFEKVQQYADNTTNPEFWNELVAVAYEIGCMCETIHNDAEWYRYAAGEAERREDELKHSLSVILQLAGRSDWHSARDPLPANQLKQPSLWQRITTLIDHVTPPQTNRTPPPLPPDLPPVELYPNLSAAVSPVSDARLEIHCLGRFYVYLNGQVIDIGANRRAKSVLKYLALHHHHPVSKEVLMDCFWPDADAEASRNNLNVAVYHLRQALRKVEDQVSHILFQDNAYLLNPSVDVWIDFEAFTDHYDKALQYEAAHNLKLAVQEYRAAEALYTGPLFDEERYEDWPTAQRNYLQDSYLQVLEHLSHHTLDEEAYADCIRLCSKMLMIDPCREDAHLRIMQCYNRQGQQHLALRQYQRCVEVLKKELDLLPGVEIASLYRRIRMNATI